MGGQRWLERLRRLPFRALAWPVALLTAFGILGVSEWAKQKVDRQLQELASMAQARQTLAVSQRQLVEAESAQRGYLITGQPVYAATYDQRRTSLLQGLDELQRQLQGFQAPPLQLTLSALRQEVERKVQEMSEVMRLRDAGRKQDALALVETGIGLERMVEVRRLSQDLLQQSRGLSEQRSNDIRLTMDWARAGLVLIVLAGLALMAMLLSQARALASQAQAQKQALKAERDRLNELVKQRTAELSKLAAHLQDVSEVEKAMLARELHDELGALLTAAKLDVARMRPKLQQHLPDLLPRLAHLVDSLNAGIALKRRIIEDLRPSTLSNLGLKPALEVLCKEHAERLGPEVRLDARVDAVPMAPSAELTAFRMVQEGLTNAAKHAKASRLEVSLVAEGDWAEVVVQDNGRGFDSAQSPLNAHGLLGMRHRLEAEGGRLDILSSPGHGTRLQGRLPLALQAEGGPRAAATSQTVEMTQLAHPAPAAQPLQAAAEVPGASKSHGAHSGAGAAPAADGQHPG